MREHSNMEVLNCQEWIFSVIELTFHFRLLLPSVFVALGDFADIFVNNFADVLLTFL